MRIRFLILIIFCMFPSVVVLAMTDPGEVLADPALEARARALSAEIRCPVCESQSIDGSDSDVARDLRLLIRERLVAGQSEEEILGALRARYGDVIVMTPPLKSSTALLWVGPFLVFLLGAVGVFFILRRATLKDQASGNAPQKTGDAE